MYELIADEARILYKQQTAFKNNRYKQQTAIKNNKFEMKIQNIWAVVLARFKKLFLINIKIRKII